MALLSTALVTGFGVACESETEPDELGVGDCLKTPEGYTGDPAAYWAAATVSTDSPPVVACDQPHAAEVFFAEELGDDDAPYPGDEVLAEDTRARCDETYEEYLGVALDYSFWYPQQSAWNDGERQVLCIAYDPEGKVLEESVKRSAQALTLRPRSRLAAGDCVNVPEEYADDPVAFWEGPQAMPVSLAVVACDEPHAGEVFNANNAWDGDAQFPGEEAVQSVAEKDCDSAFQDYVGVSFDESRLGYTLWGPVDMSWEGGDRQVGCIAYDPESKPLEGSIKGSAA